MSTTIRPITPADYDAWARLYHGYAEHYQVALTADGLAATWGWLMDKGHPVTGLVAQDDCEILGLAQYRAMPSPLRGAEVGFLDDLFVDPSARGAQVGEQLLEALKQIAVSNGWPVIRWITRDNNYRARALYDRVAVKSDWNTYEMLTGV